MSDNNLHKYPGNLRQVQSDGRPQVPDIRQLPRVSDRKGGVAGPEGTEPLERAAPERGDAQTIAELRSEIDRLREGYQKCVDALRSAPGSPCDNLACFALDYKERDFHKPGEPCPVIQRINEAIAFAKENFNITPK